MKNVMKNQKGIHKVTAKNINSTNINNVSAFNKLKKDSVAKRVVTQAKARLKSDKKTA